MLGIHYSGREYFQHPYRAIVLQRSQRLQAIRYSVTAPYGCTGKQLLCVRVISRTGASSVGVFPSYFIHCVVLHRGKSQVVILTHPSRIVPCACFARIHPDAHVTKPCHDVTVKPQLCGCGYVSVWLGGWVPGCQYLSGLVVCHMRVSNCVSLCGRVSGWVLCRGQRAGVVQKGRYAGVYAGTSVMPT